MARSRSRNHFSKNKVKKVENYFANKEINGFHEKKDPKREKHWR